MRIVIRCPHCESRSIARSSREVSITMREINYQCTSVECGHTYVANLEIVRTLSPSGNPNPAINLPLSTLASASRHTQTMA
ncbi:MAG: ogr/Delta-like zinc finger family protein [bacterium]|nr:ogr/Delta-like zinc finger family protein [bacterium]